MARRSRGPASHAVKISHGADRGPLDFYSTQYSTTHHNSGGKRPFSADSFCKRQPQELLRTRGTGYSANFRPTIYYTKCLDRTDNPPMLKVLADNYTSLTSQHFKGTTNDKDTLPHHRRRHSLPPPSSHREAIDVSAIDRPRPLTSELKSETKSIFVAKAFRDSELERSRHSRREETGFTHAQNIEPITFRPPQAFSDLSPQSLWQPTNRSVMKKDFVQHYKTADRGSGIPSLFQGADRSNGYVKGSNHHSPVQPLGKEMVGYTYTHQLPPPLLKFTSQQDPAHFSTIVQPQHYSSYTHHMMEAGCREERMSENGEEVVGVGRKELSGFAENHQPLPRQPSTLPGHFTTHYTSQFPQPLIHTTPVGGVASCDPAHNGFCRGTKVHGFSDGRNDVPLNSMHPSFARLVMAKDPCYQDNTHSDKLHTTTTKKTRP